MLSDRAAERIRRSVPEETRRAYTGDWARFTTWAAERRLVALPDAATDLAAFFREFMSAMPR